MNDPVKVAKNMPHYGLLEGMIGYVVANGTGNYHMVEFNVYGDSFTVELHGDDLNGLSIEEWHLWELLYE